ncbi:MAG: hypothetical protein AAGA70_09905 [Pseudomonadota bacterium]
MRITEDTPARLILKINRRVIVDLAGGVFFCLGLGLAIGLVPNLWGLAETLGFFLGVGFAVCGLFVVFANGTVTVTFYGPDRVMTRRSTGIKRTEQIDIAFDEIRAVLVRSQEDEDTIDIELSDGSTLPLEKVTTENADVAEIAGRIRAWLHAQGALS